MDRRLIIKLIIISLLFLFSIIYANMTKANNVIAAEEKKLSVLFIEVSIFRLYMINRRK